MSAGAASPGSSGLPVRLQAVSRRFGPVTALSAVSFDVPAGESVLLLGGNGAGKSTLLRIVAGLIRPTSGGVLLGEGFEGTPATPACRTQIGYLGHKSLLHDYLTARENLVFYARLYGRPAAEAERDADLWLADVGLERAAERPVRGFSRGMFQRLALARSLIHEPRLLLLDEPDSGLDTEGRARLDEAIRRTRARGVTILHVSHHAESAAAQSDRVVILRRGALVHDGPSGARSGAEWVAHATALARGAA